ncbi:hypothetical protein [Azospirillum soli]|nr:hypothetical protein [Azospirillum soli]MBP2310892.1 hypothetical protein [Azospirillum soli]
MTVMDDIQAEMERRKRLRGRNYAVLAALLALVALFYVITVVRMGGM